MSRLSYALYKSIDVTINRSVVIAHGVFGSKKNWASFSKALSKYANVVALDLRNHGASPHFTDMTYRHMADDVLHMVQELQLHNTCFIGHSMGGKVAMYAALQAPQHFNQLVVLDTSPLYSAGAQSLVHCINVMLKSDLYQVERESDGTLPSARQLLMEDWAIHIPDPSMRTFLLTNLDRLPNGELRWLVNLHAIQKHWHHIVGFPNKELASCQFDAPSLFVAGNQSKYLSSADLPSIRSFFPQAQLVTIPEAGHWLHVDAPHTLLKVLVSFLTTSCVKEDPLLYAKQ